MLANSPERDRDIESFQNMIRNCAAAGIPSIKYNMSLLGVIRLPRRTQGRGDAIIENIDFFIRLLAAANVVVVELYCGRCAPSGAQLSVNIRTTVASEPLIDPNSAHGARLPR